jgi:prevent-host-death family protein
MDVGIRELRAGLSRYVARVKDGEEIVVTEHGKPVAKLVSVNGESKRDKLIREGVLIPAGRPRSARPEPVRVEGDVRLSEIVLEMRD